MSELLEEAARQLYQDAVVIDSLNVSNWDSPAVIRSLHAGGLTAFNATTATLENYAQTLDNIAAWLHRLRRYEETLIQVKRVEDILQAKQENKVGVILGFQNATPIENDLDRLALFHALGVRIIQLTYNERNLLGNGCFERTDDGLSNFGPGRDPGDEPSRHPHRPLPRRYAHNHGGDRGFRKTCGDYPCERQVLFRHDAQQDG